MPTRKGSLFIFRFLGVNVFVHWSWAIAAAYLILGNLDSVSFVGQARHSIIYHSALVLALFGMVLIHEFGHSLACKSVGGTADTIVLWPLGGVAYVNPPQRPGAMLWSIAAGPLVNVILLPLTIAPWYFRAALHLSPSASDFVGDIALTNAILLIFNMLPIYPLDGGKLLWSLLWFIFGRGTSLIIAASIGVLGAAAFVALAVFQKSLWTAAIALFMGLQSFQSIKIGIAMRRLESAPRRFGAQCPSCRQSPPAIPIWQCPCGAKFDAFEHGGHCPSCGNQFSATACPYCGQRNPLSLWYNTHGFAVVQNPHTPPQPPGAPAAPS